MSDRYYNHVSQALLLTTSRAVQKFVREHNGFQMPEIDQIVTCLEADDFRAASKLFNALHFGPQGFDDWFPEATFPHEDPEYVQVVFDALLERWYRLMTTATGKAP